MMGFQLRLWRVGQKLALAAAFGLFVAGCASQSNTTKQLGSWGGPTAAAQATTLDWSYKGAPGWKIETPHYLIYTTVDQAGTREMLPQVMEGAFAQYRQLVPTIAISDKPMDCYVFSNRMQWNEYTKANTGRDAVTYLQIRRGGYAVGDKYVAYYIGMRSTASVAAHEGWHQFAARNFRGRLPPFLEEGIATTFEGVEFRDDLPRWNTAINPLRAQSLRRAVEEHNLWPTEQLVRMHAGDVVNRSGEQIEAFYAQCWAFAKFLRQAENGRYNPALKKWLAETADGTVWDPSHSHTRAGLPWNPGAVKPMIEHYLGMPFAEVDQAYQAYVRKIVYEEYPTQWNLNGWGGG